MNQAGPEGKRSNSSGSVSGIGITSGIKSVHTAPQRKRKRERECKVLCMLKFYSGEQSVFNWNGFNIKM